MIGWQRQELCRRDRRKRAHGVAGPVSRHRVVRAGLPSGGQLHGVFEIAMGQSQPLLQHMPVDRRANRRRAPA
jgi:hypothetical protein